MAQAHIDRKALKEDAFQDTVFDLVDWAHRHRRVIIAAVSAVVGAVVLGFALYAYSQYSTRRQAEEFYAAEHALSADNVTDAQRRANARQAFSAFVREYPGSALSPVAQMFLARLAWQDGDPAGAESAFRAVLEHGKTEPIARDLATIGLAKLLENQGRMVESQQMLTGLSGDRLEELRQLTLGRIALARNKPDEARKHYEAVAKKYPPTQFSDWAQQVLSHLP